LCAEEGVAAFLEELGSVLSGAVQREVADVVPSVVLKNVSVLLVSTNSVTATGDMTSSHLGDGHGQSESGNKRSAHFAKREYERVTSARKRG
jgi:hypothetical protein